MANTTGVSQVSPTTAMQGADVISKGLEAYTGYSKSKTEAANAKAALLEDYRRTTATNIANAAASGVAISGNVTDVQAANKASVDDDMSTIDSQLDQQRTGYVTGMVSQLATTAMDTETYGQLAEQKKKKVKPIGGEEEDES